ncbi:hypothetical protein A1O7_04067 [Cladophialophora yegresii CBS 114405]|uniref:Uncharacterized protein n=1 Tax=Cladophialophora yegresii CBS 114405 TaxID=1182544 RepID=W9W4K4_9EURO|nr:uncharacterized protein A1O7_04067 [Cladophialophora yegresii CBS 114405]EXJ59920.1 hypothetical protein A1O7_04067 [Cladophialophora yegresii CBS 114405]
MASPTEESLAMGPTRSSTRSNMKIAMPMPPPPSAFVHPSPAYIIASTPSPSQNPSDASWQLGAPHESHSHTHHHSHRVHISTPHPLAATANFLDKHVPLFAKHHTEFHTQHEIRQAKREARRSLIDSPIPEVDVESLPLASAAIHAVTASATAPALADSRDAWAEILAKREAARLRSGSDMSSSSSRDEKMLHHMHMLDHADEDSHSKSSGSPAITP